VQLCRSLAGGGHWRPGDRSRESDRRRHLGTSLQHLHTHGRQRRCASVGEGQQPTPPRHSSRNALTEPPQHRYGIAPDAVRWRAPAEESPSDPHHGLPRQREDHPGK
jgi:hypothetical protein